PAAILLFHGAGVYHRPPSRPRKTGSMRKPALKQFVLVSVLAVATAGCGMLYRQPIYQGKLLEKTNVAQLQTGMDKRQVMTLLGSPSVADPFHHDRWDYVATQRT